MFFRALDPGWQLRNVKYFESCQQTQTAALFQWIVFRMNKVSECRCQNHKRKNVKTWAVPLFSSPRTARPGARPVRHPSRCLCPAHADVRAPLCCWGELSRQVIAGAKSDSCLQHADTETHTHTHTSSHTLSIAQVFPLFVQLIDG